MIQEFKKQIPNMQLIIGLIIYVFVALQATFATTIMWAIGVLYIWLFSNIYLQTLTLRKLTTILCLTGIIFSVTLFFIFAVERVPYPMGALLFNFNYVVLSIALFFISSLPLIIMNQQKLGPLFLSNIFSSYNDAPDVAPNTEKWEEATIDDLESGNFESI